MTEMRKKGEEEPHDKAVAEIAKVEFPYPNKSYPNRKTYANHPERNMPVKKNEELVYPDIVVVDTEKEKPEMIGEVETASTVSEDHAVQWKEFSSLHTFFLYIPKNYASEVRRILNSMRILLAYSAVRAYEFDTQGKIVISIA